MQSFFHISFYAKENSYTRLYNRVRLTYILDLSDLISAVWHGVVIFYQSNAKYCGNRGLTYDLQIYGQIRDYFFDYEVQGRVLSPDI